MSERLEIERCPTPADVLLAIDGDLPSARSTWVLAHVDRCERCRDWRHRLDATTEWCHELLVSTYSSPRDVKARRELFKQRLHADKQARIHRRSPAVTIRRLLPIAALLPFIILVLLLSRPSTTTVEAEELLTRVALAEESRPAGWALPVRVRVTSPGFLSAPQAQSVQLLTPYVGVGEVADGVAFTLPGGAAAALGTDARLRMLLAGHHFDWQQPFSIAAFRAWRASLAHKRETVSVEDSTLRLHTTTPDGPLRAVDLIVDRATHQVIGESFVFEHIGRLDLEVVGPQVVRVRPSAPSVGPALGVVATPPSVPSITQVRPASPPPSYARVAIPRTALARWLDVTFRDEATRATFVPEVVRLVSAVKQDLSTLDGLVRRTSAAASARGPASAAERAAAGRLLDRQARTLSADLDALDARVAVLFGSTTRVLREPQAPANWQRRTGPALAQAERMERLLSDLLAHEDVPRDELGRARAHPFSEAFGALWNTWHARAER